MTYKRKKPDRTGRRLTKEDLAILKRIYQKYGETTFDAACREVKTLPARGPGRERRYDGNLISVLIAVDENVERLRMPVEKVYEHLEGKVPRHDGKYYSAAGLKSIYQQARRKLQSDLKFAEIVEQLRKSSAHPGQAIVIGDPIPAGLTRGPTIPLMLKVKP
jgi:hypothetical protein